MKKFFLIAVMAFSATCVFAQQKFAHVNFAELVQLSPEADKAREAISTSSKEAQDTYQAMVDEFNAKYQAYQQKVNEWTAAIRESKEKELTEIQQRIQEFSQSIQAELQQQEQKLMAPIYQKATETVQSIAKKGGYIYVFDKTTALYVDESQSTDLTAEARKALSIPEDRTLESLQAELQAKAQQEQTK